MEWRGILDIFLCDWLVVHQVETKIAHDMESTKFQDTEFLNFINWKLRIQRKVAVGGRPAATCWRAASQLLAPLLRRLPQEAALQAVDEGADGDEGAQLFVAGLRAVAAVELAQAVARHLGEGEAGIADMAKLAVETQEGDAVDTDVDAEFFLVMISLFSGFWAAKVGNEKLF